VDSHHRMLAPQELDEHTSVVNGWARVAIGSSVSVL
jgi:hypothetical protein